MTQFCLVPYPRRSRVLRLALMGGLVLSLGGCGSLHERMAHPDRNQTDEYYKGTQRDLQYLGIPVNGTSSSIYQSFVGCYLTVVCAVGNLVSLPVDFIVDTAYLPHDMARADVHEALSQAQALLQPSHGYVEIDFGNIVSVDTLRQGVTVREYTVEYYGKKRRLLISVDSPSLELGKFRAVVPLRAEYEPVSSNNLAMPCSPRIDTEACLRS